MYTYTHTHNILSYIAHNYDRTHHLALCGIAKNKGKHFIANFADRLQFTKISWQTFCNTATSWFGANGSTGIHCCS